MRIPDWRCVMLLRLVSRQVVVLIAVLFLVPLTPQAPVASAQGDEIALIRGQVTSGGGEPVAAASVRIERIGVGIITNEDGTYALHIPPTRLLSDQPQDIEVVASANGFASGSAIVALGPGVVLTQDFQLTPAAP